MGEPRGGSRHRYAATPLLSPGTGVAQTSDAVRVSRALVSVFDEVGLVDLAQGLSRLGVELWATSGTRRKLRAGGIDARPTEDLTGIADWFGGRLKTLHPAVLGGILAPRTEAGERELAEHRLLPFDLVVVNFYPFARRLAEGKSTGELLESIDIGGVTLARAAAKNHPYVAVASDPADYRPLLEELERAGGAVASATRRRLAAATFERCAAYDALIAQGIPAPPVEGPPFPESLRLRRGQIALRYGENPHQRAAVYRWDGAPVGAGPIPPLEVLKGEGLSYTNLLDLDNALGLVAEFPEPAAAVVKHASPCGVASASTLRAALEGAIATDPVARYGCAIAVNRPFETADAEPLKGVFVDLLAAPSYGSGALARLEKRPKLKAVRTEPPPIDRPRWDARTALGRLLVQEADRRQLLPSELRRVAGPELPEADRQTLEFAWRVVRHARSNAIVLAERSATLGIGAGQQSRVKAVEIAVGIAGDRARGSLLASDALFPFADGVEVAGAAGVRGILQPGGSLRDDEVIRAAERHRISMYVTGWRVFRH